MQNYKMDVECVFVQLELNVAHGGHSALRDSPHLKRDEQKLRGGIWFSTLHFMCVCGDYYFWLFNACERRDAHIRSQCQCFASPLCSIRFAYRSLYILPLHVRCLSYTESKPRQHTKMMRNRFISPWFCPCIGDVVACVKLLFGWANEPQSIRSSGSKSEKLLAIREVLVRKQLNWTLFSI